MKRFPKRAWLCLPVLLTFSLDVTLTLLGQPRTYWHGHYTHAQEFNPLADVLLKTHPLLFLALAVGWVTLCCTLIIFTNRSWPVILAFVLIFGHAVGAGTWMTRWGWVGYVLAGLWLFGMERVFTSCWRKAEL